jgi:uroporphyrinogen-III synthase
VLKHYDVPIAASAREPYTSTELLEVLEPLHLAGTCVGVLHYGERNTLVTQFLRDKGADVEELCLYEWLLPDEIEPLRTLIKDIIAQRVDAIVFTSQIQVRHLFLIAEELHLTVELAEALQTKTIVASIGPTCTGVLQNYGVMPHVIPEHPKMGYLIRSLADYMSR